MLAPRDGARGHEGLVMELKDGAARLVAAWGVLGVVALLGQAMVRLAPLAWKPIVQRMLSPGQVALYATWVVVSLYFEGYRAFQKRFCPRVVARAVHLGNNRRALHVALAPAFCMGFFHANGRTRGLAWGTTTMIIGFIVALRRVPQPWRGLVDGGVVLALLYGAVALVVLFARALLGLRVEGSPELPEA